MLLNTKESKPRVSAHFLLPCTEQAFSQAQPPPPTLLGKLICSVLLAPVRELLLLVRVLSVFCSPPRSRQPSHHQLQLFCLLNFLVCGNFFKSKFHLIGGCFAEFGPCVAAL
ncbi:hypothetical protein SLEP1_g22247 [Rubroshorea leprosula]|uniref:Uncharacterized protein n=1 Tax=Rubroshorea leprosula TaxID=152421 RepID=A0AAV5JJG4_9ROSI|nr:hypothetical protein SLEP1_g22247 [Rubroshorea leprosula]